MTMHLDTTTAGTTDTCSTVIAYTFWHKPEGRSRHFDRLRRGLARRLRIPYPRHKRRGKKQREGRPQ